MKDIAVKRTEKFQKWLKSLDLETRIDIGRHIDNKIKVGKLGNCKFLRKGVFELKIDIGPGYRVYFIKLGEAVIKILAGGDKSTQKKDIQQAVKESKNIKLALKKSKKIPDKKHQKSIASSVGFSYIDKKITRAAPLVK